MLAEVNDYFIGCKKMKDEEAQASDGDEEDDAGSSGVAEYEGRLYAG